MAANLLVNITSTATGTSPGTFANVPGLSATATVDSTSSVLLIIANVTARRANTTDAAGRFRFNVTGISTANSPQGVAFHDTTGGGGETSSVCMAWAVTGISGSVNFAFQWETLVQSINTNNTEPHTLQVIEFTSGATLAHNLVSLTSSTPSANFGPLFTSPPLTPAGPTETFLLLANVIQASSGTDHSADFRFAANVGGAGAVPFSAETSDWNDQVNEYVTWSGLSRYIGPATSTVFTLQHRRRGAGAWNKDTTRPSTFQIIRINAASASQLGKLSSTGTWTIPGSFGNDPVLSGSNTTTTDKINFVVAGFAASPNAADHVATYRLGIDNVNVGPQQVLFSDNTSYSRGGFLAWATDGLSAASHNFSLRGQVAGGSPTILNGVTRELFVMEFAKPVLSTDYTRPLSESASVSESSATDLTKSFSESTSVSESIETILEKDLGFSESADVSETSAVFTGSQRLISDSATVSESLETSFGSAILDSETADVSESLDLVFEVHLEESETADVSESIDAASEVVIVDSENTDVSESIATAIEADRDMAIENPTVSESIVVSLIPFYEQEGFLWRDDDGSESGASALQSQDTAITLTALTNARLRVLTNVTGDPPAGQATLQYRKVGDPDTQWRDVPL